MTRQLRLLLPLLFILLNLAGCASVYRQAMNAERSLAGLERKEIVLPDGLRYVYLEGGQGEPLMLLHGFGGNKDNFTRTARYLTPHYRVIVPDHIGFGESAHPQQADYTAAAQAQRLHTLAHALGVRAVHLGGNSMGGHIAMAYAVQYPDEVSSLWLLNPAGVWTATRSEAAKMYLETGRNPLIVRSEDEFVQLFDFVMSEPPFVPRPILNVMAKERINNVALEERIFSQIVEDSIEKRINGMETPALIVWGDRDRVIHVDTAAMLHKLLPRSQVLVMPGIGHLPMLERPQQSAEDYLKFRAALQRTPG
ncbi:alpha/beta fold hydrolase [Noviherbaspirillum agri]